MPASGAECWWRHFREIGSVAVHYVELAPDAAREASALRWLDPEERARWRRFRHEGARRRFALCRAALRSILCSRLGCRNQQLAFGASHLGKPYAVVEGKPVPIGFNVSHGSAHGLIAFAGEGRLGVDLEERSPERDLDGLIHSVMGPRERADLALARGTRRLHLFYLLWTVKEALIKALGTGLSWDVSQFEVPLAMRRGMKTSLFQFPHIPAVRWWLEDLGNEHFAAAVAHELPPDSH
jgi:4'-phosphopantetheinyl transferase